MDRYEYHLCYISCDLYMHVMHLYLCLTGFKMNFLSHLLVFFLVHAYIWLEFIYRLVPCLCIEHKIELSTAGITTKLPKPLPIFQKSQFRLPIFEKKKSVKRQKAQRNNYVIMNFVFRKLGNHTWNTAISEVFVPPLFVNDNCLFRPLLK